MSRKIALTRKIALAIVDDISTRHTLSDAWYEIDDDIQREIVSAWAKLARDIIADHKKSRAGQ